MKKLKLLLTLLLIVILTDLKAQIPYTLDSTKSYWPNGMRKSYTRVFSSITPNQFSLKMEYHENGTLNNKELSQILNKRGDKAILGSLKWDNKGNLLNRVINIGYLNYYSIVGSDSITIISEDQSSIIKFDEAKISKLSFNGFIKIPSGKFSNFNSPYPVCPYAHINEFYIQETEITNLQYRQFTNAMLTDSAEAFGKDWILQHLCPDTTAVNEVLIDGKKIRLSQYFNDSTYNNYPVIAVNWFDAKYYCEWLTKKIEQDLPELKHLVLVRLPTEIEWEYAATEGKGMKEYLSEQQKFLESNSNIKSYSNKNLFTLPVKSFSPNKFGLYDMIGNTREWCEDAYLDTLLSYQGSRLLYDPFEWCVYNCYYNDEEARKVVRGGSFHTEINYKGLRDYLFQDSSSYFDETKYTTKKVHYTNETINVKAFERVYKLKIPYKKLPPDTGFRVVIELYNPRMGRKYVIGCEMEEF